MDILHPFYVCGPQETFVFMGRLGPIIVLFHSQNITKVNTGTLSFSLVSSVPSTVPAGAGAVVKQECRIC